MALYLKELALLETTSNTLVKLVNVMEGVEGSAVFGYNTEDIAVQVNANQTLPYKTRHTLDIRVIDDATPATQATLTEWANTPGLKFKASGYSGNEFLLWDEPTEIVFSRQPDQIGVRRLTMTLDAKPGYNGADGSKKMPVYAGSNIMMLLNQFLGSSTHISGWSGTMSGGGSTAFSAGTTTITLGSGTGTLVSYNYLFPFEAVPLTGSYRSNGGGGPIGASKISVSFLDASEVELSETTGTTLTSGSGTFADSGVTATGTYYIRVKLFFASGFAGSGTTMQRPALRLGYGESSFAN